MAYRRSGEISLMVSVLTTQVQDYINAIEVGGDKFVSRKWYHDKAEQITIDQGRRAKFYIFDDPNSDDYVFGFNSICKIIDLDPEKLKTNIRLLRKKKMKEIYDRIKKY